MIGDGEESAVYRYTSPDSASSRKPAGFGMVPGYEHSPGKELTLLDDPLPIKISYTKQCTA